MRASDVHELQLKLQKLQQEMRHHHDSEPSEEVTEENIAVHEMHGEGAHLHRRDLRIDDFEVSTTLGTGTFGRVRQVKLKNDQSNTVYALKMLKKTEILRLNQVDHIKSERAILEEISHPFLVNLKASFQDPKYIYMLFEYISGGELFSRLRKDGRFANDVALFYACEIMLAIQYLHKKEIVYRDLKPENLLIDKHGHIKITDFGFAKRIENDRTYTLCGTPEYLAPEIIKGSRVGYGKSVDWWAVGILIFEMLSGYPPFYDNEPVGIYKKIIAGIIEFPRFFDVKAKDLIRKLLNPEISLRLGVNDDGEMTKKHRWFRGVDWDEVYRREIPSPWIPILKNEEDCSCFEKYPDSKEAAKELPRELHYLFEDF